MSTITVLMPVYNAEKYLNEAIDSILNQSYKAFDFLIINDGSEDTSEKIILSYKDQRIRYIKNEENLGIAATLNKGIDLIDTDYIVRMDADDIAVAERIKIQKEFMDTHPEIGVSSSYLEIFGNEKGVWTMPLENAEIKASLVFGSSIAHAPAIIRTQILKKNNIFYRNVFPYMEDYDLWYRLKDITIFSGLPKVLYLYRRLEHNVTIKNQSTSLERLKNFYTVLLKDMGIQPTEEELLLHCGLGKETLPPTKENLKKYKKWLEKLTQFNNKLKIYPAISLEKVIISKWDSLFYFLPPFGHQAVWSYFICSEKIYKKHIIYYLKYSINSLLSKLKIDKNKIKEAFSSYDKN